MPLRFRLAACYAALLALVVAGFSAAMVVALRASLRDGIATEVETLARGVGGVVELEGSAYVIEDKTAIPPQFAAGNDAFYVVADARGAVLLRSPLAVELDLGPGAAGTQEVEAGGRRFLAATVALERCCNEDAPEQATTLRVTCGRGLGDVDRAVGSLARTLWWLGPGVLLVSLLGGLWLAGRALAPIGVIAATAAAIDGSDLSLRVPVRGRDELARLAGALNRAFDRLEHAFLRQQRFTADASHELRTPLTAVAGNAELLQRADRSAAERAELVAEILAATGQMQVLIDDLLTLARADHADLARTPVALRQACLDIARQEGAAARDAGVSLQVGELPDVAVPGDANLLRRLLANLVQNGVRYNAPGGSVRIMLGTDGDDAVLEVADDGIGIAPADLPRLGERFFRVDAARRRSTGGSGLGLSIVLAIAAAHGGSVRFRSQPERGTTVEVRLPGAQPTAATA